MAIMESTYYKQVMEELDQFPIEYLPALLKMMRAFRESVAPQNAEESFRQAWQEAINGETLPISELWVGIDAE